MSFFFRPIPGISHFRVDASVPNKTYEESEELEYEICSGDGSSKLSEMPTVINPFGMSQERKQYLCDKIRQFCPSEASANLTCPKPNMTISQMFPITEHKKTRKCSHCRQSGHTKTVRGIVTCPELLKKH